MIAITSPSGLGLIHQAEQCRLVAYLDTGGIPTIGWGTTRYPTNARVALGDRCTQAQADTWFARDLQWTERAVDLLSTDLLLPRQFDALVSFTYNEGEGAYRRSQLRQKVNADPNDPSIRAEFMKWYFVGPAPVLGLWRRRHAEADHYFNVATLCPVFPPDVASPQPPVAA
jgi:lysozyme